MVDLRSSGGLGLPPSAYQYKGSVWRDVPAMERFPPRYPEPDELFGEYLANPSSSPSRHAQTLANSGGLMELHYDSMRRRQKERSMYPTFVCGPTMTRPFLATSGYGGHIPGKESNAICSCTFGQGSRLAYETTGRFFHPPMSSQTFTIGSPAISKSQSLPQLGSAPSPLSHAGGEALKGVRSRGRYG